MRLTAKNQSPLLTTQLHYKKWPTPGSTSSPDNILALRRVLTSERSKLEDLSSPVLVHCPNGSSHTGILIALDNLAKRMEEEDLNAYANSARLVDVANCVFRLRQDRCQMVCYWIEMRAFKKPFFRRFSSTRFAGCFLRELRVSV